MILRWPSDLPLPQRNGYQGQNQDPRSRRRAQAGPPAYRPLYSSAARNVSLSIHVDRDQKAVFDGFYDRDTKKGVLPFLMADPVTDGWRLLGTDGLLLLDPAGTPLLMSAYWLCLFGDTTPTEIVSGVNFVISFSVAVMP